MQRAPLMPSPPQGLDAFGDWFSEVFRIWSPRWGEWTVISLIFMVIAGGIFLIFYFALIAIIVGAQGASSSAIPGYPEGMSHPSSPLFGPWMTGSVLTTLIVVGLISLIIYLAMVTWLTVGVIKTALKTVRNQPFTVGDLFSGGDRFWPALGVVILQGIVGGAVALASQLLKTAVGDPLGSIVNMLVSAFIGSLFYLAMPIIVDRPATVWEAVSTSWSTVSRNYWLFFLFNAVMGLLGFSGIVGCCVGIIVTIPWLYLAVAVAYERTFFGASGYLGGGTPVLTGPLPPPFTPTVPPAFPGAPMTVNTPGEYTNPAEVSGEQAAPTETAGEQAAPTEVTESRVEEAPPAAPEEASVCASCGAPMAHGQLQCPQCGAPRGIPPQGA